MTTIITCVGSRKAPECFLRIFEEFGNYIRHKEYWARSGHADGIDYAIEKGARNRCITYLPWPGFNSKCPELGAIRCKKDINPRALEVVLSHEPYVVKLSDAIKKIKCRNVYQLVGENLDKPSDLVVCWTLRGEPVGGTGLVIKMARHAEIPIINLGCLWDPDPITSVEDLIKEVEDVKHKRHDWEYLNDN
jgi:hypothetical protein